MQAMWSIESKKTVSQVDNAEEVRLPRTSSFRKVLLHSQEEVQIALDAGKRVLCEEVVSHNGASRQIVYVEAELRSLIEVAR